MASDKNPVRTIRVAPGSALERLIAGKPFTEAVHKIAEVLELAMAAEAEREAEDHGHAAGPGPVDPGPLHREPRYSDLPHTPVRSPVVEPYDPFAPLDVTDDDAVLRAAAEQYPSGLVPVSVIHEDDDDNPMDLI